MKRCDVTLRIAMAVALAAAAMIGAVDAFASGAQTEGRGADGPASAARAQTSEIGEATNAWLNLQRTNTAAAPALPTPGAQATLAYDRYLDSFRTRIPASFGSALSGEGNAARGETNVGGAQPAGAN
jgi:hypothetical protein